MKTPSLDEMKLTVAKMLPDDLLIHGEIVCWNPDKYPHLRGPVRETEWLHACMLAEETLTEEEDAEYVNEMDWLRQEAAREKGGEADYGHVGPVEFRLAALCSVKHPEMFTESTI